MNRPGKQRWVFIVILVILAVWALNEWVAWQESRAFQDREDLEDALDSIAGRIIDLEELDLDDVRGIIEDYELPWRTRRQLDNFLDQLNHLLQQDSTTENLKASQVLA